MEKFISNEEDILINVLRNNLKKYSKNNIKSFLTKEMVLVNNKVQTRYDYLVHKTDKIEIRETKIKVSKIKNDLNIIYEDEDLIVVNKPHGLLSIATKEEKEYTLYHFVSNYLKEKNKNNKVFIIHRLDKDTSGIVIFAKNQKTKNLFQNNWDKIVRERKYYAVVNGTLKEKEGTIKNYLVENDKSFMVYSTKNKNEGKLSITDYKVLKENKDYSLLDINIKTGRKNQIRVTFKDLGNPIVGDKKYGDGKSLIKRMALHQYKVELIDPRNNKKLIFKTEMPTSFKRLIK
jgi:RluA family pseudouridine synthase